MYRFGTLFCKGEWMDKRMEQPVNQHDLELQRVAKNITSLFFVKNNIKYYYIGTTEIYIQYVFRLVSGSMVVCNYASSTLHFRMSPLIKIEKSSSNEFMLKLFCFECDLG